MIRRILLNIAIRIGEWALNRVYNFIDKNKDGKLSKKELKTAYSRLEKKLKYIRKKLK